MRYLRQHLKRTLNLFAFTLLIYMFFLEFRGIQWYLKITSRSILGDFLRAFGKTYDGRDKRNIIFYLKSYIL